MQAVGEGRLPIVQAMLDGGAKITPQDSYRILMLVNGYYRIPFSNCS